MMKYNSDQMAIIKDNSQFIQVIAGAGSGKTSTMIGILDRILQEGKYDPRLVVVVTFSRKATSEFQERLHKLHPSHPIRIQTFHAYCLGIIREHHPEYKVTPPSILSEIEKTDFFRSFFKKHRFRVGGIPYKYLMGESNLNLQNTDPELYNEAIQELEIYKKESKKLEFQDLVSLYLHSLEEKEDWTLEPKSNSRYLIVDEFQDTDEEQLRFLRNLEPDRLTVVGDDWQAIYGFRGATPKPFMELGNYFFPLNRHFLSTNYRSLDGIVKISQIPILKNQNYISKNVDSFRKGNAKLGIQYYPEGRLGVDMASKILIEYIKSNPDTKILCRTNFRIAEFKLCGIPEDALLTIHASKGLEFSSIFVDLMGGWNQDPKSTDQSILEEERRILYVAMSRAKDALFLLARRYPKPNKNLDDLFVSYFSKLKISKTKYQSI